jgi:hypothetical protein
MVVFLALACLAGQAAAPTASESRFRRMDRDGDGFVTANEAPRVAVTRGADGAASPGGAAWIATYDRDGDGKVSAREYGAGPRAAFMPASFTGSAS